MCYKVLEYFEDLNDNRHPYHEGDIFPREGMSVSEDRIEELSTDKNRRKTPLIEKVDEVKPKETKKRTRK